MNELWQSNRWRRARSGFLIILFFAAAGHVSLHAQHTSAAGLFLGISQPEKHVTWHGLADTTERDAGFSIGAVFEIGLSEMFTLVLSPQYSEVSSHSVYQFRRSAERRINVGTPPIYAIELPVCIRAGIPLGGLNPYISVGGFLGYAYSDEAYNHSEDDASPEPPLPFVRLEELSTLFSGVQIGAGICADVSPGVSLMLDWTLNQHLTDPIDTDMVTWEAPLRGVWRFGIVFPFKGGAQ